MYLSAECFKSILKGLRGDRDSGKGIQQRRKSPRVGVRAKVELTREAMSDTGVQKIEAIIRDLSSEGLGLLTTERLSKGEHVWIELPMSSAEGRIVAEYIVCYCARITTQMYSCGATLHNYVEQADSPEALQRILKTEKSQPAQTASRATTAARRVPPGDSKVA